MATSQSSDENTDDENKLQIREDLSSMTFEEIMKLKEELGAKVYKEAVLGVETDKSKKVAKKSKADFKRLNKNRPRELPTKRQVPFLGAELRTAKKTATEVRDPRFDENAGDYDVKQFKENYKFLSQIRQNEAMSLKKELENCKVPEKQKEIKGAMQRLLNKNVEEQNWHARQDMLKKEQQEIQQAQKEGRQPHYTTKKERRAKELVMQFEQLKQTGKLNKHLEKRRKKNAAKDRKKFSFD